METAENISILKRVKSEMGDGKENKTNLEEFAVSKFYDSRLLSFYRNSRFKAAVKMSGVRAGDRILDFGCFRQELRRFLPKGVEYYGYDKNLKYGNVEDWKKLPGIDTVFALAVFEHIPEKTLEEMIKQFKRMGVKKIVAEFPWEDSPVNRFMCWLLRLRFEHYLNHVSGWKTIAKVLNRHYECVSYRSLLWANWISVWEQR